MRIGIIGAGNVGTALGRGWVKAGHQVVYGMRSPGPAPHEGASTDSIRGAASSADAVVLATPWTAVEDALAAAGDLSGRPLLDATNPIGPGFQLALGHTTSGAEHVAAIARNARVVKAFNTTGFENMEDPRYGAARVLMPVCGDDQEAVGVAARLASDLRFDAIALPSLSRARDLEPFALLWIKLAMQWGVGRKIAYGLQRRTPGDTPPTRPTQRARRITIVGSGNIGGALAKAWLRAGHSVRIASRDTATDDVRELVALGATALPVAGAAGDAEVVVFAIPADAVLDTARAMGDLSGKVLVDCTNAIGKGFTLIHGHTTSASEVLAQALPGVHVVRAFNQQGAEVLRNPVFSGRAATNFVAGDDPAARALVAALSVDAGLDTVEAGPLSTARCLEPLTLLWIALSQAIGTREFGLSLLRR